MKKTTWLWMVMVLSACSLPTTATPPPTQALPFESLTPAVAAAEPMFEMQAELDDLKSNANIKETEIAGLEAEITRLADEIEALNAELTQMAITPTATIRPTSAATSTPSNVMTVVALQKLNLRFFKKSNNAGNPIMLIYEPRIQYQEGEIFQVLKPVVLADGGTRYYQVVGPRGAGLYVRTSDVTPV